MPTGLPWIFIVLSALVLTTTITLPSADRLTWLRTLLAAATDLWPIGRGSRTGGRR